MLSSPRACSHSCSRLGAGHLYEHLDAEEWERVFALVERMPRGARSLRRAIEEVDPSFES